MPDVVCVCGRYYRFEGDIGACPRCGEYASPSRFSPEARHQMRDELDLPLAVREHRISIGCSRRPSYVGAVADR